MARALGAAGAFAVCIFSEDELIELVLDLRTNEDAKGWQKLKKESQIDQFWSNYTAHLRKPFPMSGSTCK